MAKRLWVERNKDGSWDAFSEDGAHIKFGKGRGQFTPGDLMKIALAGCAALSSQFAVEHTLGEGKGAKIVVDGTYDADNDAYTSFEEQVEIDATDAGLSDEDADKLAERIANQYCYRAIGVFKQNFNRNLNCDFGDKFMIEQHSFMDHMLFSHDFKEAVAAYSEKRAPVYTGD